jgi:hypothetical protein
MALHFAGGQVRGSAATRHEVLEHMAALFLEDADSETKQVVQPPAWSEQQQRH